MTGPEKLREFLRTATPEELAAVREEAREYRNVGPKLKDVIPAEFSVAVSLNYSLVSAARDSVASNLDEYQVVNYDYALAA